MAAGSGLPLPLATCVALCTHRQWTDFWGVLLGWAYRQGASSEFKTATSNTDEQLVALAEKAEAEIDGRFDVRRRRRKPCAATAASALQRPNCSTPLRRRSSSR